MEIHEVDTKYLTDRVLGSTTVKMVLVQELKELIKEVFPVIEDNPDYMQYNISSGEKSVSEENKLNRNMILEKLS